MTKVLVTGATGMLGCSLVPLLQVRGHEVVRHGHRLAADVNVDLADSAAVARMLNKVCPDVIVNLAALTNVDACETDPHSAYVLNVRTVENLSRWARANPACHLVQISTDQVYDGNGPFCEDQVIVRNYYAFSKLAGEIAASSASCTILRTNFFGRSRCAGRSSLTDWLYGALTAHSPIKVFDDVLFSPLSINTLIGNIEQVVCNRPIGVFNLGSREGLSKADFAYAFAATLGLPDACMSRSMSTAAEVLKAYRPKDMRMDCSRFEQIMNTTMPKLLDEINLIRSDYLEQT